MMQTLSRTYWVPGNIRQFKIRDMKLYFLIGALFVFFNPAIAQDDYFDMPTITALIEHNKQNYSDNQELRDRQVASQVTVSAWKKSTNTMKKLTDAIDKRMNSFFIITADVSTTIHVYQCISQVLSYQQQALTLAGKYP